MRDEAPFSMDHAGFSAEFRATRAERGWSLAFVAFAPLWSVLVCFGVLTEDAWDFGSLCMVFTVPFIGFISWIGVDAAVTRRSLKLANGQLLLVTRKLFTRRQKLDVRGLKATVAEHFTNKGGRIAAVHLRLRDGQEVRVVANNWTTPDLEELVGLLNRCADQADEETALVPPAALQALRQGS